MSAPSFGGGVPLYRQASKLGKGFPIVTVPVSGFRGPPRGLPCPARHRRTSESRRDQQHGRKQQNPSHASPLWNGVVVSFSS